MSKYNAELKPFAEKYVKVFYNITKDYKKEQVLHEILYSDGKTPHIYYVVILIIKKLDKKSNT